jgi:hypothetical protein
MTLKDRRVGDDTGPMSMGAAGLLLAVIGFVFFGSVMVVFGCVMVVVRTTRGEREQAVK